MINHTIIIAVLKTNWTCGTPFVALLPTPPSAISPADNTSSYALFPFLPQGALPWTSESKSTFRSRKVGDWLGEGSETPTNFSPDGIGRQGMLLNIKGYVNHFLSKQETPLTQTSELSSLEDIVNQCFKDETSSCTLKAS